MKTPTIDDLELLVGAHETREEGMCAMEAVAWLAGEPHSDHPQCACPVISALMRSWNDVLPDEDRNRLLKPLLPLLVGSKSTPEVEGQRAYVALDWLIREHTVAWLRLAKLTDHADTLAGLDPIISLPAAESAGGKVRAAGAAARAAAWDAAWAAAWDAAWAAARAAAGASARDAARAALHSTVLALQESCVELIWRMVVIK